MRAYLRVSPHIPEADCRLYIVWATRTKFPSIYFVSVFCTLDFWKERDRKHTLLQTKKNQRLSFDLLYTFLRFFFSKNKFFNLVPLFPLLCVPSYRNCYTDFIHEKLFVQCQTGKNYLCVFLSFSSLYFFYIIVSLVVSFFLTPQVGRSRNMYVNAPETPPPTHTKSVSRRIPGFLLSAWPGRAKRPPSIYCRYIFFLKHCLSLSLSLIHIYIYTRTQKRFPICFFPPTSHTCLIILEKREENSGPGTHWLLCVCAWMYVCLYAYKTRNTEDNSLSPVFPSVPALVSYSTMHIAPHPPPPLPSLM